MKDNQDIYNFSSISLLMRHLGLPAPLHPLITFINYDNVSAATFEKGQKICLDFYKISFKTSFTGQVKYGQAHYDFEEGGLAFMKPKQLITSSENIDSYEGCVLYFHPDFIRNYSLANSINQYGFFSYAVSEALYLSSREKNTIRDLLDNIAKELADNIDQFSQSVLVSQIELLLNYSNRYYNRQFITREAINHKTIMLLDDLLDDYFKKDNALQNGLPSVQYIAETLHCSSRYLSDMLKSLTGLNTQQYIQNNVIERSKNLLSTTPLSVSEIAYQLGFVHPQSFSKLFRNKTHLTPLAFRKTFN